MQGDRTTNPPPFAGTLNDISELSQLYRPPHPHVSDKVQPGLDEHCRGFIAAATLVFVASGTTDGHLDVSPRGGPPGFVRVLDDERLAIPDLRGNNRLDTHRNVIATSWLAATFVVPGVDEVLRVNGDAWISTDPTLLDAFTDELHRPICAIAIRVREAYLHCAKALRRARLWDPSTWPSDDARPRAAEIFRAHIGLDDVSADHIEQDLEMSYAADLAAERTGTSTQHPYTDGP